ncbi:MAG TPA: DUF4388 domain-containing protein [Pyrinomonadaceae bacterium]|nr:DUF4388 domain-containing protein [Pyrinomonadaceae bacterium]
MENRILDAIRTLAANGETGSLQLQSGATQGDLFFRHGEVVDARVGNLTGFPAVNAIAAMRDAAFNFDPSVAPPPLSSIRPSERVVLKQFFGIHAAQRVEEATVELPRVVPPRRSRPKFAYRFALVVGALLVLVAITAVALRNRYQEQAATATVASSEQPAPATATLARNEQPAMTIPAAPAPATTRTSPAPATTSEQPAKTTPAPAPPVDQPDLTGKWTIVNTVQNTSYGSYKNLQIGFDLSIKQDGNGFTGEGRKISENGRTLPANSRTPIHVKGSIEGDRIEANFFEDGAQRKSNGRFVWKFDKTGSLNGTFSSSAARASGRSTARKEL